MNDLFRKLTIRTAKVLGGGLGADHLDKLLSESCELLDGRGEFPRLQVKRRALLTDLLLQVGYTLG